MIAHLITWWFALQVISLVGLPITIFLFHHFPFHGYSLNKTVSLLLVGYASWLLALFGFGSFNSSAVILALFLVGGAGLWIIRWPNIRLALRSQRGQWRFILLNELFFAALLLMGLWLRESGAVGAAIIGTEKPMDLTFLSSIFHSQTFPPHDPWLAGYAVNYYYLGYLLVAAMAVISQVSLGEAYNLGIATIFALTALTISGLFTAMVRASRRWFPISRHIGTASVSLLGIIFILIAGNQAGALQVIFGSPQIVTLDSKQFLNALTQRLRGSDVIRISPAIQTSPSDFGLIDSLKPTGDSFNWWWPSRAVWDTVASSPDQVDRRYAITEFPFFSFYLGDLHPHVLALPFGLLALSLAFATMTLPAPTLFWGNHRELLKLIFTSIILGSLYVINSWDAPTYLLLYLGVFVLSHRRYSLKRPGVPFIGKMLGGIGCLMLGCLIVILPFLLTFQSFAGSSFLPEPWSNIPIINSIGKLISPTSNHTNLYAFLSIFGLNCTLLLVYVARTRTIEYRGEFNRCEEKSKHSLSAVHWIIIAITLIVGSSIGFPLLALLPLIIFLVWNAWQSVQNPAHAFIVWAAAVSLLVILVADVMYIRDPFENRMNTVFKFYYQAWIILGIIAAYAVWALLQPERRRHWSTPVWVPIVLCLITGSLVYPLETLINGKPWIQEPWELDGLAFLERQNPDEAAALHWIQQHTSSDAIVLTAVGSSYDDSTGRVASVTGRPTLLGWSGSHERLWRSGSSEILQVIAEREQDIQQIYTTNDWNTAQLLLDRYRVDYIYVGQTERRLYPGPGLSKFGKFLQLVYYQGEVQIFRGDK